jgi:mono/diheme cytochrome c family protein
LFEPAGIAALLFLIAGIIGIIAAVFNQGPRFRKEAAGLGAVAIVAGAVLLLQSQIPPSETDTLAAGTNLALATLDAGSVERGREIFAQNCVTCHGPGAKGDGPGAASLTPPPADLTSGHSIPHPDSDYLYWIENGIAGTGMPAFGDVLTTGQIQDVITYVRSLQQQTLLARDAPGPEGCQVAPRTLDEIAALSQTAGPAEPPNATETGGIPADQQTIAAITDVAREMVACSNAGDILRRLALYSDNRLRFAYPDGPNQALRAIADKPLPVGTLDRVALLSVDDVRTLEDGRVSARVRVDNPAMHSHDPAVSAQAAQQETARLIFVQEDGAWRVDETRREETPRNATPIPVSTSSGG